MTEHKPDTFTVRSIFADYWHDDAIPSGHPVREQNRAEFDRWIAQVKAEAWDEGYGQGDLWHQPGASRATQRSRQTNPYREGA